MNKHSSKRFDNLKPFFKGSLKGSFTFSQEFLLPNGRLRAFPPLDLQAGALSYHPTLAHSIFEIS